jgi:hypothetical protein
MLARLGPYLIRFVYKQLSRGYRLALVHSGTRPSQLRTFASAFTDWLPPANSTEPPLLN